MAIAENAARLLLDWSIENRRGYPWRRETAVYPLAIAEVLLQKTKAADVEPVWTALRERFPNPEALAEAAGDDLREMVSKLGLGTQRVQRLQSMARAFSTGGHLAGIGPYGRAVLALATGQSSADPPVDGNIARIVTRVLGLSWPRGEPRKKREVRSAVAEMLAASPTLQLTLVYALVDLGAMVCKPANPRCGDCPLRQECATGRRDS